MQSKTIWELADCEKSWNMCSSCFHSLQENCPNTDFFLVCSPHSEWIQREYSVRMLEIWTRKNSVFGHFLRSDSYGKINHSKVWDPEEANNRPTLLRLIRLMTAVQCFQIQHRTLSSFSEWYILVDESRPRCEVRRRVFQQI